MLRLEDVTVDLAGVAVLRRVSLQVPPGARVALIGRNGAGKTTTLRTLMGLVPSRDGRISLDGRDCTTLPAHRRAALGIGYAPEERRLFGN
ncbi:MAG TPA: ATP-binding cassette domain-containing protein, partial [Enterovirga sp.]